MTGHISVRSVNVDLHMNAVPDKCAIMWFQLLLFFCSQFKEKGAG